MSGARVLIDCRVISRRLDGLGRYTLDLARAILREPEDFDVHLLIPASLADDHPLRAMLAELRPSTVVSSAGPMALSAHLRVAGAVRRIRPDLYHYPHFNLPLAVRCRSVVTIHDLTPLTQPTYFRTGGTYKRWYFRFATGMSLRRSRASIAPSVATAADVVRLFRPRIAPVTIEEGIDHAFDVTPAAAALDDVRARFGLPRPYLLYVGVDRPHKNLERVVEAFARIADRVPHDLVIVGQGHDALAARAAAFGIGPRLLRLGYLGDADVRLLYAASDAFVLCSLVEGFGLPVVEAMRSGTPVVTSRGGATEETAGGAALLVDPRSIESIAEALLAVCTEPALRADLRARGLARAGIFTWERAARRTLDVYRAALG